MQYATYMVKAYEIGSSPCSGWSWARYHSCCSNCALLLLHVWRWSKPPKPIRCTQRPAPWQSWTLHLSSAAAPALCAADEQAPGPTGMLWGIGHTGMQQIKKQKQQCIPCTQLVALSSRPTADAGLNYPCHGQVPPEQAEALWGEASILEQWVDLLELECSCQRW